jgi:hypothetical protein
MTPGLGEAGQQALAAREFEAAGTSVAGLGADARKREGGSLTTEYPANGSF